MFMRGLSIRILTLLIPGYLFVSAAAAQDFEPVTREMLENPSPDDWLMLSRTYDEQRYSPLDQVNTKNVNDLRMAWTRGLPTGTQQTIPLVYNGHVHRRTDGYGNSNRCHDR